MRQSIALALPGGRHSRDRQPAVRPAALPAASIPARRRAAAVRRSALVRELESRTGRGFRAAHPGPSVCQRRDRVRIGRVSTVCPPGIGRQRLTGTGWAVAAMFRPGGARPFLHAPARDWVDAAVEVAEHWGADGAAVVAATRSAAGPAEAVESARVGLLQRFLAERAPTEVPFDTTERRCGRRVDLAGPSALSGRGPGRLVPASRPARCRGFLPSRSACPRNR